MKHSRRDFIQGSLAASSSLAVLTARAEANVGRPARAPLRVPFDPDKAIHIQWTAGGVLAPAAAVWNKVPADLYPVSVLAVHNEGNTVPAWRFEKYLNACRENGVRAAPEIVYGGSVHESTTLGWLGTLLKKNSNVVGIQFICKEPGQLNTTVMREHLELCGRNGAYFIYNMSRHANTLPQHLDAMVADPGLRAAMKKYSQNIILNYGIGGFQLKLTDGEKAERLAKATKMRADGLIGRIAFFDNRISGADVIRERANGCTAFGGMAPSLDYWHALRNPAKTPSPRWNVQNRPMHIQASLLLADVRSTWHEIPEDIRPIAALEPSNLENGVAAEDFEDCFIRCQKDGVRIVPELVRHGEQNDSVHAAWLDGMLNKYPVLVGVSFNCTQPGELDTKMIRTYIEVCGQNNAYFFFNVQNKALTLPEELDKILADRDLVSIMRKYHANIVIDRCGGGMRGTPTEAQKAESLRKLKGMVADGLIGRIGAYHMNGSDVAGEHASGCTVFGRNGLWKRGEAEYWASLRKVMNVS